MQIRNRTVHVDPQSCSWIGRRTKHDGRVAGQIENSKREMKTKLLQLDTRSAARKLIKRRWRELAKSARALHKHRSGGRVHDFRVTLRRLRGSLAFCDEQLGLAPPKSTRRAVKALATVSGALRDWEVTREQLESLFSGRQDSALAHDCTVLLNVAQRRAEKNFARIFQAHRPMLKTKIRLRAEREVAESSFGQVLALHVLQLLDEIGEINRSLALSAEALHALRVASKNVRYTLESMDDEVAEDALPDLRRVQERLGAIHDMDQAIAVLHRWEPQLVRAGAAPGAPDFPWLMQRAAEERAARLVAWQRDFPLNGAELFGRIQARIQALAATDALELALA